MPKPWGRRPGLLHSAAGAMPGAADHDRAFGSEQLSRTNGLELFPAGLAEIAHEGDRAAIDHIPEFDEGLVRLQISIDDLPRDAFGAGDDLGRGQDSHPVYLGVDPDQSGDVRLGVLERVDIARRGLLDELPIEVL